MQQLDNALKQQILKIGRQVAQELKRHCEDYGRDQFGLVGVAAFTKGQYDLFGSPEAWAFEVVRETVRRAHAFETTVIEILSQHGVLETV